LSTSRLAEIYADEPYQTIHMDRELNCVLSEWKGFATSLEFRAGSNKVFEAIRDNHAVSLVIDNRRSEGVAPLDQLWIRDTFVQLLESAGLRRLAVVVAHHGLAKIAVDDIRGQTMKSVIETRTFATVPEAIEWAAARV
jgi:hypothetical protein